MRFTLVLVVALAGCVKPVVQTGKCQSDADCGNKFEKCDPTGVCRCLTDDACDASEFCNVAGSCQQKLECLSDDDCQTTDGSKAICDTRLPQLDSTAGDDQLHSQTSGQCITLTPTFQCLLDSHCGFGFYCSAGQCVPGCKDDGDCPIDEPCLNNQCDPTPGACDAPHYCQFGQLCSSNDTCVDHRNRAQLCQECKGDDPLDTTCPGACLIDPAVPSTPCTSDNQCSQGYCVKFPCNSSSDCPNGETCTGGGFFDPGTCSGHCGDFFCGSDACDDQTDPCPNGYSCFQLILVSNNTCTRGGGQCRAGATCSADTPGAENVENGSCSCLSDADCPQDPFSTVTCVNPGPNGACISGSTCAPFSGLTCQDLR